MSFLLAWEFQRSWTQISVEDLPSKAFIILFCLPIHVTSADQYRMSGGTISYRRGDSEARGLKYGPQIWT